MLEAMCPAVCAYAAACATLLDTTAGAADAQGCSWPEPTLAPEAPETTLTPPMPPGSYPCIVGTCMPS